MTTDSDVGFLGPGGSKLWADLLERHDLDPAQRVQLLEACRAKDRLDQLDELLRGEARTWAYLTDAADGGSELVVDKALAAANSTATLLKQLLAALRLPDEATGQRPQRRPGAASRVPSGSGSRDRIRAV